MQMAKLKVKRQNRRKRRIRKRLHGTSEVPRMTVFRSLKNIYVQLIDDTTGKTICEANTRNTDLRDSIGYPGNCKAAAAIGKNIAERAKEKGIERVVFDRNGFLFHGRLKALADCARQAGLKF